MSNKRLTGYLHVKHPSIVGGYPDGSHLIQQNMVEGKIAVGSQVTISCPPKWLEDGLQNGMVVTITEVRTRRQVEGY